MSAVRALAEAVQANTLTPCRVATATNLTLAGLSSIDGVTVVAGDRVLVKSQTDTTENGIWIASSGAWVRASDFNGVSDLVSGSVIAVTEGTLSAETLFHTSFSGLYSPGSTSVAFVRAYDHVIASGWSDALAQVLGGGWVTALGNTYESSNNVTVDRLAELSALDTSGFTTESIITCLGRAAAGDGYEGRFRWTTANASALVSVDTDKAVYVAPDSAPTGASGALVRIVENLEYSIMWWDVDPTGVTTGQNAKFLLALELIDDLGGGDLIVHGVGTDNTFLYSGACAKTTFTNEIRILGRGLPTLKAGVGQTVPVLNLYASSLSPDDPVDVGIHIEGIYVDCSQGNSAGATQACTAVALTGFKRYSIEHCVFYGGTDPTNTNADSGNTTVNCGDGTISNNSYQGWPDAGIYPGGNNTVGAGGDGGMLTLENNYFLLCNQAISPKREMSRIHVKGGKIELCAAGIVPAEVGGTYVGPAQWMHIEGVTFKKITANAVRFRGPCKGLVHDCLFEDWGLTDLVNETTSAGANAYAVVLQGTTDTYFYNNLYRLKDWAKDIQRIYQFDNVTLDGVTYTHGNCRFSGEIWEGIERGWTIVAAGGVHYFNDIHVDTVATPFPTTNLNSDTLITYTEVGSSEKKGFRGSVPFTFGPSGDWQVLASSGVAASHTGDTAETTLATVTIPGGLMGANGTIRVSCSWTCGANNANIKYALVKLNGASGSAYINVNLANTLTAHLGRTITNRNNESSQVGSIETTASSAFSTSSAALPLSAINTAADRDLVFMAQLANGSDTLTLESYLVEVQHRG